MSWFCLLGEFDTGTMVSPFLVPHPPPSVEEYIGLVLYHPVPYTAVQCCVMLYTSGSVVSLSTRAQHSSRCSSSSGMACTLHPYHYYYSIKIEKKKKLSYSAAETTFLLGMCSLIHYGFCQGLSVRLIVILCTT